MKVAIIGSRGLTVKCINKYLPENTSEIVSGGARGIDACARRFALSQNIKLTEFLPDYEKFGKYAPIERNKRIIEYCDCVLAFWDGKSKGTLFVINECKKKNVPIRIMVVKD